MSKIKGCTCHLEAMFLTCDEPEIHNGIESYAVIDAECEVVSNSRTKDYADLIAYALNRLSQDDKDYCTACRIHKDSKSARVFL